MENSADVEKKYEHVKAERQKYIDAIITSDSAKKIVVAGPGTGKTYLFKQILKGKKNSLTLTFVNALVEDLSLELYGMSDVRTLHSFARSILSTATQGGVKIFPKLSQVIREDAISLMEKDIDFDFLFHNRDDKNEHIEFYKQRKDYYEKYYGYSDIVYALVKYFEDKKDKIPTYEQIVVDEFQDFNKLEVSLIELLAEKSPILLAGDDDQALYDFKSASAKYIRKRHASSGSGYAAFGLPFCSRCTRVIVNATNDIIASAMKVGCFQERINKQYLYFDDKNKDKESDQNPHLSYAQIFAGQIPWFIEQAISRIAEDIKSSFSVLIISPTKVQSRGIVKALKEKGFSNIAFTDRKDDKELTLLDGLKILEQNSKSNLGWRIVLKLIMKESEYNVLIKETTKKDAKNIWEIIDKTQKKEIMAMIKLIKAIKVDNSVDIAELDQIFNKMGLDPRAMEKDFLKEEFASDIQRVGNPGLRKIPIKATTIQSSKGLAAEYVFITHFDDQFFIKNKDKKSVCDQDMCNFLVALTRARKKVFLISSNTKKEPIFLQWIDKSRIERV